MANPRKLRLIYQNDSKSDRVDAAYLARTCLVRARTQLISHVRGSVKSFGGRLPRWGADAFARKAEPQIPEELGPALSPLLRAITQLTLEIKALDVQIEETAEERYPETRLLTQVPGVGTLTAQCFMLTIEDPARFPKARAVASYVGLRPRHADSGSYSPAASDHQGWG